tara:strand:+ start:358 stop:723 length:366 start_codon:yes stop_codon:yes gene_type:complete
LNNQSDEQAIKEISVAQLNDLVDHNVTLVDVREEYEFVEIRADGAKLLPLDQIPKVSESLPSDEAIYIICASGNRSMVACEYLSARGFSAVNIIGGTIAWNLAGYKVNSGPVDQSEIFASP